MGPSWFTKTARQLEQAMHQFQKQKSNNYSYKIFISNASTEGINRSITDQANKNSLYCKIQPQMIEWRNENRDQLHAMHTCLSQFAEPALVAAADTAPVSGAKLCPAERGRTATVMTWHWLRWRYGCWSRLQEHLPSQTGLFYYVMSCRMSVISFYVARGR